MERFLVLLTAVIVVCTGEWGVPAEALSVSGFPPEPRRCRANEEWKECVSGSCADTTCDRPVMGPACTEDCHSGCFCSEGFYRNGEGNCVTLNQCSPGPVSKGKLHPACGLNQVWKTCVSHSCAETTCEKRTIGPACTLDCAIGCFCSSGFFRNAQGNCVSEDQCPAPAVELSLYRPSGSSARVPVCVSAGILSVCLQSEC